MENTEVSRCGWVPVNNDIYRDYHDKEWGVPVYDDNKLFEMLVLESFQAGLAWIIVLKKREDFRIAFDNFDYHKIITYNEEKIIELLNNEKIIRSRSKINATISNAKIFIEIQKEFGSFSDYIWSYTDHKIIKNTDNIFQTKTELSDIISKDLKKRGIKYFGSVIAYSYLQAVGIVNDHETTCFKYDCTN
jgi:DNA-3-methyladenine glycosylase I